MPRATRIVLIAAAPEAIMCFLKEQIRLLHSEGYEVHSVSSPGIEQFAGHENLKSEHHEILIRRTIRPLADIVSLWRLWRLLRQVRPGLVQTHTPKAGLLGMIAASLAAVPVRLYTVNGLPIVVRPFWSRPVLALTEWLSCALATEVLCVSRSVRRVLVVNGFCKSQKCRVLGDGGCPGVDTQKFSTGVQAASSRAVTRKRYAIPEDSLVLGYIGRIVPAKGIRELALAWGLLRGKFPQLRLFLCGYGEPDHPMDPLLLEKLRSDPRVHFTSQRVEDMPPIYASLDINVLPTYCEGLPNVVLEASAMGLPTVAARVPGCVDSIRDRITGLLVRPKDPQALAEALQHLIESPERCALMGTAAREFVSRRFSSDRVSAFLLDRYKHLLKPMTHTGVKPVRAGSETSVFADPTKQVTR